MSVGGDPPVVSVVLTCFNHQEFVEQALDAVAGQTHRPIQLIVADDASADDSAQRIAGWLAGRWPDATFIRHRSNQGLCRTLNEALAQVAGEYVAISSADDWMEPERLERLVDELATAPAHVGLVYSGLRFVDAAGNELALIHTEPGSAPSGAVFHRQLAMPVIPTPAVMVRRSVFDTVGGFNETDVVEDYDMWLRVTRAFDVRHVPGALVNFRWHAGNTTTKIQGAPYEGYVADCLRRQLGHSDETDRLIHRRLDELRRSTGG
jgi:glycosyltransferase involved in cell wall biosynthesis